MFADVLEGMRGKLVDELGHRLARIEPPSRLTPDRRARLNRDVTEVIEALRRGGPDDSVASPAVDDPDRELDEHELVERILLEQAAKTGDRSSATEIAIAWWRCRADRSSLREQTRRLAMLLDEVKEGAAVLAPDARLLYCNRRAAQGIREVACIRHGDIIGQTPDEIGLSLEHLVGRPVVDLEALARARASLELCTAERANETQFDAIYRPDGQVGAVVFVVRDTHNLKQERLRLDILSKLSALSGVLDFGEVAAGIANVPIPELADWCTFHVVEDKRIRQLFVANRDPSKRPLRDAIMRVATPWDRHPLWQGMLTSGYQLLTEVSDDLLRKVAGTEERYRLLSLLGIRSVLVVPLVSHARVTGVLSLIYTHESGRRYGSGDPMLAKELALYASNALENARLMTDLKASETRFRVALGGARTVVFEQDASLHYTWFYNPFAREGNAGKTPDHWLASHETAVPAAMKNRVLEQGESITEEVDVTLEENERRHYREAIEPMRDRAGKIVGIIGAATDITEQQAMQQQLTDDVSFRERMMGVLGHDLRNPLNTIALSSDLLLRRAERSAEDRKQFEQIRRATDRMKEMIDTLLDFTRLRFGAFPLSFRPADLGEIARAVVDEIRAGKPERSIELRTRGTLRGQWDPARVSQAITNLVSNALAYGEPETTVTVDVDGNDRDVTISVNNLGAPIPPAFKAVIFEPFRRDVPHDRSPNGLGLGLYIVQQIVLAHRGEIHVESNSQDGTTFTMRLPVAAVGAAREPCGNGHRARAS
jgi:signal transduction histidine kinase